MAFVQTTSFFAQESIDLTIDWQTASPVEIDGIQFNEPQILGQNNERGCVSFTHMKRVKYANAKLLLNVIEEDLAPNEDMNYLNAVHCLIPDTVSYQLKVTSARNEQFLVL